MKRLALLVLVFTCIFSFPTRAQSPSEGPRLEGAALVLEAGTKQRAALTFLLPHTTPSGSLRVQIRLRTPEPGSGWIAWRLRDQERFQKGQQNEAFSTTTSEVQQVEIVLPVPAENAVRSIRISLGSAPRMDLEEVVVQTESGDVVRKLPNPQRGTWPRGAEEAPEG